ncbi:MAG TPA: PAS domain S-box protein [Edaphobacter sp.]|nr:PAS domain S-box protein [Edaphobacter sp.]
MATQSTINDGALPRPPSPEDPPVSSSHSVQFYEEDSSLIDALARFIGSSLLAGNSAIVIATEAHRKSLVEHLKARGLDTAPAIGEQRFLLLDASETLALFMLDGRPDPDRFLSCMDSLLSRVHAVSKNRAPLAAFGEMVALLWADGNQNAAVELEQLWNRLAETHCFHLHCAYPIHLFADRHDAESIKAICAEHSSVIPGEQYTSITTDQQRQSAIVLLQQKAQSLETEVRERLNAQHTLQERELQLNDFLENAAIGMHWVAEDGTILWANKAELALLGYRPHEYIGHHITEFHADRPVVEDILKRLGNNEELQDYEARVRCSDGSIRDVRIDSNVYRRDGQFIHTRCFTTDITEKKHAQQASFRLAAIVESSDDAIVSKDLNGIVKSWNAGAERIFGYKPEEILGRPITLLIPHDLWGDETRILAKIRSGERIDHFQTVRLHKNGDLIDVSLTVSPIKDKRGGIIGAAKIARDITQQKKLEASLHTTERLASVGRLAATVAHEINNPLESVINFVYLAKQQPEISTETRAFLASADQELARVAHIAQQTLGFYRDNSQPVVLSLAAVIESVLKVYHFKLQNKALQIELQIDPGLTVLALQGEVKQILSNLMANAIDASHQDGAIFIRARAGRHPLSACRGVRITIADNGTGIAPQNKARLFVPFFTTKQAVGTGLGLWITKDLLEKKGGSIQFRSSDSTPTGTVMSIFLPEAPHENSSLR